MEKISTSELNELFNDTINRCTYDLIDKEDEIIEYELFEEFDIGATSFLHEKSLDRLLEDDFIDEDIRNLCLKLRELFFEISDDKRSADNVRHDKKWADLLKLADTIKEKKKLLDLGKS